MMRWFRVTGRPRRPRRRGVRARAHYLSHREGARALIHERLAYWSAFYNLSYNRVAIRDQRTRWGSCSKKGNLNFNYRLALVPPALLDYVIVHELCHLIEFNHSPAFWSHVARALPEYRTLRTALRKVPIDRFHKHPALMVEV